MSTPRVSVIIPVYNAARYLPEALDSVLAQSFVDFEVLVHDDGSSDASLTVLQDYAQKDPRVCVTTGPNQGIVGTLNQLVTSARGEFLARMDGDDICDPERFAKQVAFLDTHPEIGLLGTFVDGIDADGRPIRPFEAPIDHEGLEQFHLTTGGPGLWHPSVMMRRTLLEQVEGYRETSPYCEDYDLWLRMGEITQLANLPEQLVQYRLHLQSLSVVKRDIQIDSSARALREACERRGLPAPSTTGAQKTPPRDLDVIRKWAWWALQAGNMDTAWVYAVKGWRAAPLSWLSVKLCAVVMRDRLRRG